MLPGLYFSIHVIFLLVGACFASHTIMCNSITYCSLQDPLQFRVFYQIGQDWEQEKLYTRVFKFDPGLYLQSRNIHVLNASELTALCRDYCFRLHYELVYNGTYNDFEVSLLPNKVDHISKYSLESIATAIHVPDHTSQGKIFYGSPPSPYLARAYRVNLARVATMTLCDELRSENTAKHQLYEFLETSLYLHANVNTTASDQLDDTTCSSRDTNPAVTSDGINSSTSSAGRLLCIIYTYEPNHRAVATIAATWGAECTGFLAFSNLSDFRVPTLTLSTPHDGGESYGNMWNKVRAIWSYVYQHYLHDFDWFLMGGDDMYVLVDSLKHYLDNVVTPELRCGRNTRNCKNGNHSSCASTSHQGVYLGRELRVQSKDSTAGRCSGDYSDNSSSSDGRGCAGASSYTSTSPGTSSSPSAASHSSRVKPTSTNSIKTYNSGGAGYVLNQHAVKLLSGAILQNRCKKMRASFEDINVAYCLQRLGILPYDTRDATGKQRFHFFSPTMLMRDPLRLDPPSSSSSSETPTASGDSSSSTSRRSKSSNNGNAIDELDSNYLHAPVASSGISAVDTLETQTTSAAKEKDSGVADAFNAFNATQFAAYWSQAVAHPPLAYGADACCSRNTVSFHWMGDKYIETVHTFLHCIRSNHTSSNGRGG